jgi:hypothetical protein
MFGWFACIHRVLFQTQLNFYALYGFEKGPVLLVHYQLLSIFAFDLDQPLTRYVNVDLLEL